MQGIKTNRNFVRAGLVTARERCCLHYVCLLLKRLGFHGRLVSRPYDLMRVENNSVGAVHESPEDIPFCTT